MIKIFLIVIFGLGLRIYGIFNFPVIFDEAHQIILSRYSDFFIASKAAAEGHPPLNLLILKFWQVVSQDIIFIRILPVMFGVTSILAVIFVGKKLFDLKTGLIAGFLTAISPSQIYYSSIARMYALGILEAIVISYFFIKFIEGRAKALSFAILMLIGLYTHFFFIIMFFSFNLYIIFFWKKTKIKIPTLLTFNGLILLFYIPAIVLILISQRAFATPITSYLKIPAFYLIPTLPYDLFLNNPQGISGIILACISLILLFLSILGLRKNRKILAFSFIYLVPPILIFLFSMIFFRMQAVRSFVIFSPLFFLIISKWLAGLPGNTRVLIILLISVISISFLTNYSKNYLGGDNELKIAYSNFTPQDTIFYNDLLMFLPAKLLNMPGNQFLIHAGYLSGNIDAIYALDLKLAKREDTQSYKKIWYVYKPTNWPPYDNVANEWRQNLAMEFKKVKTINYKDFQLILYEKKN